MVFVYSPHREGGGTLHVPSPSNSPRSNPNSALDQLRRSLSRSPSKGPAFRLVTSKSNSPSPNSPLSPSPLTPSRRSCLHGTDSTKSPQEPKPLASPFVPNSRKKQRPNIRHLSPMRPSARPLGIQRSPARRALADSSDHGNATPVSSASSSEGVENEDQVQQAYSDKMDISVSTNPYTTQETGNLLAPHHALGRKDRPSGYFDIVKSSPLKRSEGSTNLDLAYLGTPAKRRSLHGAFFGPDFNIFDHAASLEKNDSSTQDNEATGLNNFGQDSPSASTPLSHRSSSLRKTTLQQRFEKPSVGRARLNAENFFESRTPHAPDTKARDRLSLDFSVPQLSRESPFSNDNLPNASIHPAAPMRREVSGPGALPVSSRHPLARTISQSSSNSSIAVDSPTHIPVRNPGGRRPKGDLSRSLPFGAFRPTIQDAQATASSSETSSFTTPNNYKLAKPLPAAFMSTGLISKRNKNIEHESLDLGDSLGNMPDTPCKRPTSLTSISPQPTPDINLHKTRQARHTMHSFGTPSTPFNPNVSRAAISNTKGFSIFGSGFNGEASRRGSFAASDAEDGPKSPLATVQREQSRSFEIPPTPTKQALDSQYFPFDAKFPSPDASRFARSVYKNESAIGSPESAINCKSILISTPSVVRGGENNGDPESSPSNMLRFRSLNSIPSFSKRLQAGNRSHCPTPLTKTSLSLPIISKQNQVTKQSSLPTASPIFDRHGGKSPHTPLDTIAPPDPSGLSISAQAEKSAFSRFPPTNPGSSSGVPATPTAPRDSFGRSSKFSSSLTPMHHAAPADVDTGITSRFDKVEPLTTGEFSQVFRVSCAAEPTIQQFSFNSSFSTQTLKGSPSEQVWAVKKASRAFIGPRDRQRKLQEVEILKSLGRADHTVNYVDSWEYNHHLYIQTEFCEEGTLDLFLEKAGRKARLDDFRIWKIMLELSLGLKHVHDSGFIHLDLKPANILITFEGVLKIADFGMATSWPAQAGIEGEGDRGYIGPEILKGQFDKPADVFAFGLIMLEIAGNVRLPDNGASWQRLRSGDMSDVPSLTSSSDISSIARDASGNPHGTAQTFDDNYLPGDDSGFASFDFGFEQKPQLSPNTVRMQMQRAGELHNPPEFMINPDHDSALDRVVRWMISPEASERPMVGEILSTDGVRWTEARRRAGATIFEGNYGPADDILQDDAEMIDV